MKINNKHQKNAAFFLFPFGTKKNAEVLGRFWPLRFVFDFFQKYPPAKILEKGIYF
jgi:hypothetical protein